MRTFVRRVARTAAAADQRQVVASEEHLDEADAAVLEVCARSKRGRRLVFQNLADASCRICSSRTADLCTSRTADLCTSSALTSLLLLLERIAVVDAEAVVHAADEAALVLIEAGEQQPIAVRVVVQVHSRAAEISRLPRIGP